MATTLTEQEMQLEQFIKSGQNEAAINLLSKLAMEYAAQNQFERAENFRDQMYEIDNMALEAILKVNNCIEKEKSKSIAPDRKELWANFFDKLSNEEANAFFLALEDISVEEEKMILTQGEPNDALYLINQGSLKIIHERNEKQMLIHTLGPGDSFGEDTFFSINVCTVSIKTLSKVKLSCLKKTSFEKIQSQHPEIEENLIKICGTGTKIVEWLRQKGMDRRAHKRYIFQTQAWFQILTSSGGNDASNSIAAELYDISLGGVCFYFRSKDSNYVRNLVGRTIGINIIIELGKKQKDIALTGVVQGVQNHPLDEYSVHVKLRQNLSEKAMETIIKISEKQLSLD